MKTLKIAFLLLAVVLLTVSGQSSDTVTEVTDNTEFKQYKNSDLLVHNRKGAKLKSQG